MTSQTVPLTVFAGLLGIVIVWFVLLKLLFNRLEGVHPQVYEAMGRPSLFLRNSIAGTWATLRFVITREHKRLDDRSLSKLSDAMLVYFTLYLVVVFGLFFIVAGQGSAT